MEKRRHKAAGWAVLFFIAFMAGCAGVAPIARLTQPMQLIEAGDYPDFSDDLNLDGMANAIDRSLEYLDKVPPDRSLRFGSDQYPAAHIRLSLERFRDFILTDPSPSELQDFIRTAYRVYQSAGRDDRGEVLFTGYYEPNLMGSRQPTALFAHPIYGKPKDLISIDLSLFGERFAGEKIIARIEGDAVLPYFDREQISSGHLLAERAEALAWVADPVDVFFLQVQGSGKVYLEDGDVINIHYHTTNGRPYRSIGQLLIEEGKISREEMSMQKIRQYLHAHPEEIQRVFDYNPSYVFFKVEPQGPLGNINVKLTPGRSLALDYRLFPPAVLAFAETFKPEVSGAGEIAGWVSCRRFMLNQDTGGAIRGAGRADVFWGNGPYAEIAAGHMKHAGRLFFLVLKPGY